MSNSKEILYLHLPRPPMGPPAECNRGNHTPGRGAEKYMENGVFSSTHGERFQW